MALQLGGQSRDLRFGFQEVIDAEDVIGRPLRILITRNRGLTASQIITLLWATCRQTERGLTAEHVKEWVREAVPPIGTTSLLEIENAIVDAIVAGGIILPRLPEAPTNGRPSSGASSLPETTPPGPATSFSA